LFKELGYWNTLFQAQHRFFGRRQGDQIGNILAQWVIVYYGQLF
jgi:hypothetical protein